MKLIALTTLIVMVVAFAGWADAYGLYGQTTKTPRHDFRVLVTQGRVVAHTTMVQGQTQTVPAIDVKVAMNAHGKIMNDLQNRRLKVIGPLADEVTALQGHEVVVRGIVRKGNLLEVTWIEDKKEASQDINAPTPVW